MICSLSHSELANYISRQLNHFFPDGTAVSALQIKKICPEALKRLGVSISATVNTNKYFWQHGQPWFDHLNSDQYAMFLYLLARVAGEDTSAKSKKVATKIFLLNKALHALDVYFEIKLPEIFLFAHPIGTVLGRADYGNYFMVMQNSTVGNIDSRYPVIGEKAMLCSGSSVLGHSVLKDAVCVGAGSLLINAQVPANSTVVGRGKELRILRNHPARWSNYFKS